MEIKSTPRGRFTEAATLSALLGWLALLALPAPGQPAVELELHCENPQSSYQTNATVAVGDVDGDGDTEIVGVGGVSGLTFIAEAWIMNAGDCSDQLTINVEAAGGFSYNTHVGLLDIDGDGDLEIIGSRLAYPIDQGGFDNEHLIAVHHDGSLAWPGDGGSETSPIIDTQVFNSPYNLAGPTFSDLDADGTVEIVMPFSSGSGFNVFSGLAVYNAEDGSLAWDFLSTTRQGAGNYQKSPTVADLDLDGTMEIIIHNNVIDHQGVLELVLPSAEAVGTSVPGHLYTAVANFDDDDFPEIVARDWWNHYLFEHDGTIKWQHERFHFAASQLTVADFDGDGEVEYAQINCGEVVLGNCGQYFLEVNETDGSLLWSHQGDPALEIDPSLWSAENATAFDANRDGAFDLVMRNNDPDVASLFIFDGRDGRVLESVPAESYPASFQQQRFVTVADVDGDGHAELINSFATGGPANTEIWTGTAADPLPAAPTFRNQWLFNDAYVDQGLTIPANPVPHWLQPGRNGFHLIPPERVLPIVFTDGFESGDLSAWSASIP